MLFCVCLEVSIVVMGLDLLLANMNIPSTGGQLRIKYHAPVRAIGLLIPANLVVFQVSSGEEALLAAQMITPIQDACRNQLTTPALHNHQCKQKDDGQDAIVCDLQHAQHGRTSSCACCVCKGALRIQMYISTCPCCTRPRTQ